MSVRLAAAAAAAGLGVLAVGSLAMVGSASDSTDAGAVAGWTGHVDAVSVADRAAMTPDDASAVALLARSARAATAVAYSGRAVSWDASGTVVTDLVHLPGRGTLVRPVGSVATPSRPELSPEGRSGSFADEGRTLNLLRINYRVLREADLDTRIAGRTADAVLAVDSAGRLAARYWLDHATGVLLEKELVTSDGQVRSRTAFTTFHLGAPVFTTVPTPAADPWGPALGEQGLTAARARGCACPDALPGGLTLLEARDAPAGTVAADDVVHQLFSDGLTSVSLFSMAGGLAPDDVASLQSHGFSLTPFGKVQAWARGGTAGVATLTVVWAARGQVLTLVTDDGADPRGTAGAVLAAIPPSADPSSSWWTRVQRGWHRLFGGSS